MESMGSSVEDVEASRLTLWPLNTKPNMTLDVWTLRLIGLDWLVRLVNYCCSSIRVASINENKNSHWKITMTHTQTTCSNRITLCAGKKEVCPAGVGALASVFEKSATELKQQKLLKYKHATNINI